jgi:hypothetical protein
VARRDITPPVGIRHKNWGASEHEVAEGVHRPLTATVLTFGDPPLVLVALDLGWWRRATDEAFLRQGLLSALGLSEERLMVCLSHTHAGPTLSRDESGLAGGEFIEGYLERLVTTLAEAVEEALATPEDAVLEWSYGFCDLATHRDLPDVERYVVGFNPGEPADATLLVGRVSREGRTLATLVNYACHPTTLAWENRLLSPDYIGAMREMVESATGAPCLFLQGASGELAPRDQYRGDGAWADRNGRVLGHAVLATLEGMAPPAHELVFTRVVESGAPLADWQERPCSAPIETVATTVAANLTLKDLPTLEEIDARLSTEADSAMLERARRERQVRLNVGDGPTMPMAVTIWEVGDSRFVGVPAEAYSRLQMRLRSARPNLAVAVMNVANGWYGYLPPRDLYEQDVYSVWQTPFAAGCLEAVEDAALAAIAEKVWED